MNKSNETFTDYITHKNLINSNQYYNFRAGLFKAGLR